MRAELFWKQVCDRDLPDFEAVERAVLAVPSPARRPRGVYFAAAALALVVLAAGAAGLLGRGGTGSPAPQMPEPVLSAPVTEEAPDRTAETEPEQTAEDVSEADVVVFNELPEDQLAAAMDVALSRVLLEHAQSWNLEQILDYWGFDPLPKALPEGLAADFDEDSTWRYAAAGGLVWDQFSFSWREDPGGEVYDPLERRLTVTVAGSEILQCGFNFFEEELEPSKISGVEMWLGKRDVGYGPYTDGPDGEKIPAGYYPLMEADFRWKGLYFQVTAENLTEDEFVAVLKDMVK